MTLVFRQSAVSLAHCGTAEALRNYTAAGSGRLCGMPKAADRYHVVTITYNEQ